MQLDNHIIDLLYRHDCVTVPGLGSFITRRIPAQIYSNSNQFYPPKKGISFNAQLHQSDGIFIKHIAAVNQVSYSDAGELVQTAVRELKTELNENNRVVLNRLGILNLTDANTLSFTPTYLVNLLPEAFGLESFQANQYIAPEILDKSNAPSENDNPVVTLPVTEEVRRVFPWKRYAAVGIVLIGIAGAIGFNTYRTNTIEHNIAQETAVEETITSRIQEATFVIDTDIPAVNLHATRVQGKYHIIAGAFRNEENADKKLDQLKAQGYPARNIGVNPYGLHTIVYSSHVDRVEALQTLRSVKKESNPAAWLLVKEL